MNKLGAVRLLPQRHTTFLPSPPGSRSFAAIPVLFSCFPVLYCCHEIFLDFEFALVNAISPYQKSLIVCVCVCMLCEEGGSRQ